MSKAAQTRKYILESAFSLIYKQGFQATSIDCILENTNVTKGAFYYHFKSKDDMGMALINEVIFHELEKSLIIPLQDYNNPLNGIYQTIKSYLLSLSEKQMKYGCSTTNLVQELPPISEQFKAALHTILHHWQNALIYNLRMAIDKQLIKPETNLNQVSNFIITGYQGARITGKIHTNKDYFQIYLNELERYLHTL